MQHREGRPIAITPTDRTLGLRWGLLELIDAVEAAEFRLIEVVRTAEDLAELRFDPLAYPYGGVGGLVALVEAFGFRVVGIDDGTGYWAP